MIELVGLLLVESIINFGIVQLGQVSSNSDMIELVGLLVVESIVNFEIVESGQVSSNSKTI